MPNATCSNLNQFSWSLLINNINLFASASNTHVHASTWLTNNNTHLLYLTTMPICYGNNAHLFVVDTCEYPHLIRCWTLTICGPIQQMCVHLPEDLRSNRNIEKGKYDQILSSWFELLELVTTKQRRKEGWQTCLLKEKSLCGEAKRWDENFF